MPEPEAQPADGREALRVQLTAWLDLFLSALAVPFLILLVIELAGPPPQPWAGRIAAVQTAIWAVFVLAFLAELTIARSKTAYLRSHWLVALSLALPLLRVFRVLGALRILRGARAARGLNLARILTRTNRVTRSLRELMRVSQFAYLVLLTALVTLTAAAGVTYFERGAPGTEVSSYGEGLWWAASVVMTADGPGDPVTLEGRLLAVGLRVFGLAVFGYLTARIAVFFLRGRDEEEDRETGREVSRLTDEVARLSAEVEESTRAIREAAPQPGGNGDPGRRAPDRPAPPPRGRR